MNFTLFFPLRLQLSHHNCNILAGALHNCTKKVKTQTAMNGSNHVLYRRIKNYIILSQFIWSTIFSKTEKSNTNMYYTYYNLYKYTKSMITSYILFSASDLSKGYIVSWACAWYGTSLQYLLSQS